MGGKQSLIEAKRDMDSVVTPGRKVIQTSPLDEHCDFEHFWPALISSFKTLYKEMPAFKDGQVNEKSDNSFEIFSLMDGSKNTPPGEDSLTRNFFIVDKEKGTIYMEERRAPLFALETCSVTTVVREPLQVEFWRQFVTPIRNSGISVAEEAKTILSTVLEREVNFVPDMPSLIPGISNAMSEPLDDHTTMEELWTALIATLKSQQFNKYLVGETQVTAEEETKDTCTFSIQGTLNGLKMVEDKLPVPAEDSLPFVARLLACHPLHSLSIQMHMPDYTLVDITSFTIFPTPLHVDVAKAVLLPPNFPPEADEQARTLVETCVNFAVSKAMDE